jgi:peptide deformylase
MIIVEAHDIPAKDLITDVPMDDPIKVYKVCQELKELCEQNKGIGISAVQAGVPWKLFLIKGDGTCPLVPDRQYGYFINCEYEAISEEQIISLEGCLSLRSSDGRLRSFQVKRYRDIRLFGFILADDDSLRFKEVDCPISYLQEGIVFQHEIDHQRSILISDNGKEIFVW